MNIWMVRCGKNGEREKWMLDNNMVSIGWDQLKDMSKIKSKEELREIYIKIYQPTNKHKEGNHVGQLWSFLKKMEAGDYVAVPLKSESAIAIGKRIGGCLG